MASRRTSGHSSPVTLQLVGPTSWTEVPALLLYDVADPFAVRIAFGDTDDDPDGAITWLLSRELLQAGLERPAGDGDVRLWPAKAAADVLYLHLRAPSGEALFEVSRASVAASRKRSICRNSQTSALISSIFSVSAACVLTSRSWTSEATV